MVGEGVFLEARACTIERLPTTRQSINFCFEDLMGVPAQCRGDRINWIAALATKTHRAQEFELDSVLSPCGSISDARMRLMISAMTKTSSFCERAATRAASD